MKARLVYAVLVIGSFFSAMPSLGQKRLDVLLNGPWILYRENSYGIGANKYVLVAIAPGNAGHSAPLFTTGDGTLINSTGFYCVAFTTTATDRDCTPRDHQMDTTTNGGYPVPNLLQRNTQSGWDWSKLPMNFMGGYVLILPMPDSWSADGQYPLAFGSVFPPPPPKSPQPTYNLGVLLHYSSVAAYTYLNLTACEPSYSTAKGKICDVGGNTIISSQENTGTLRITMQTHEDPTDHPECNYHDHLAYHAMMLLLDPLLSDMLDQNNAFIGLAQSNTTCEKCDPQSNNRTGCPDVTANTHRAKLDMLAIPEGPTRLFTSLDECKDEQKNNKGEARTESFSSSPPKLAQNPRKSELAAFIASLNKSKNEINKRINHKKAGACDAALELEQKLIEAAEQMWVQVNGLDGIDCRASIILIQ